MFLTDKQLYDIYGEDGVVLEDQSTISSSGQLFVKFGRDLYWPETLVNKYIFNYKLDDPYEKYFEDLLA